jgi:Fe-S cluster assembly protein SufD
MTGAVSATHPYVEALLRGHEVPRDGASWLDRRRAAALERANALTVPTTRDEEWRFTDLSPLTRQQFETAAAAPPLAPADIERFVLPEAAARLVFVDGIYAPALSFVGGLPAGIEAGTLAEAVRSRHPALEPHLARLAAFDDRVFAALNTAWLRDGALIVAARGAALEAPVHVLCLATRGGVAHPRCLVVAQERSECTIVEDYASLTDEAHFTNAVVEIAVAADARVRHVRLQRENPAAFHIAASAAALAKDARYDSHAVAIGARLSRLNLDVLQQGEGVQVRLDGLALISGQQLADTHTTMDHAQPHGRCVQLHKTVVGGAAHAVFNGKICVRRGAQLTDSSQQSRNLLLSERARVDTKPQLEIFADDVKCAHGATVGQLDAEQLFYLRSRGLPEARARSLLTYAFAAELIERIPVPSLAAQLERLVLEQTGAAL